MAAPTRRFARWLQAIDNRNASGEYYLTDVIAHGAQGRRADRDVACRRT